MISWVQTASCNVMTQVLKREISETWAPGRTRDVLNIPLVLLLDGLLHAGPLGCRAAGIPASQAGRGVHEETARGGRAGAPRSPHPLLMVAQESVQRAQLLLQTLCTMPSESTTKRLADTGQNTTRSSCLIFPPCCADKQASILYVTCCFSIALKA